MLEIVNEPSQDSSINAGLREQYYPGAYAAIRAREAAIGIGGDNSLHVQVMNTLWGSGNPESFLTDKRFMAYDDHRFVLPLFISSCLNPNIMIGTLNTTPPSP